jgi:hypothetical protein
MIWVNENRKPKKLDAQTRQEIANNVIAKLEQNKDLKTVADNMVGLLVRDLKGIKDERELLYAIGVATSQIKRYIASQVYNRIKEKQE